MSSGRGILIIEDDDTWRTVLKETLEDQGYDVMAVGDYQTGREALEKCSFDLVLLDLELDRSAPMLEGVRLLTHLAQHQSHTPCIIVSGKGDVHIVRNAFKQYHVVDFIAKDKRFDILTFVETVKDALTQEQPDVVGDGLEEMLAPLGSDPRSKVFGATLERTTKQQRLVELLQVLTERFDTSELRTLCFHLSIDYEDLPGEGKLNKSRELIRYLYRRDRVAEMIQAGRQLRPDISWEHLAD
jgi:DNA-binding response OmpR family regulator